MSNDKIQVYTAALVIPVVAPPVLEGCVAVKDGRILHIGERNWVVKIIEDENISYDEIYWDGIILPGLVNAHTHLQYTGMSSLGEQKFDGFSDWAKSFNVIYDDIIAKNEDPWALWADRGAQELIQTGTTCVADVVTNASAFGAINKAGLHGIAYWEVMGWGNGEWNQEDGRNEIYNQLRNVQNQAQSAKIGVSPHAPYSLDVQPLLDVPDIARSLDMRLHIHLAEAAFEQKDSPEQQVDSQKWSLEGYNSFNHLRKHGVGISSTEFVDQLGILGPDCHIAHGIYVNARDREILRSRNVYTTLCPRSNSVIGLDEPPIAKYLEEGNLIAIGTDSLSSSPSLDLLADVAELYSIARKQGYSKDNLHKRLIYSAILGGATALGLNVGLGRLGGLGVGSQADLAFFDVDVNSNITDSYSALCEDGAGKCSATIIEGIFKYTNNKFTQNTGVNAN